MCHTIYEKDHGCNHMTCTRCHPPTHFCYLCGNILNDDNPLKHFSNKESKCYNKLWDDPKKNINIDEIEDDNDNDNKEKNEESDEFSEDKKDNEPNNGKGNRINSSINQNIINQYNDNHSDNLNLTRLMFDRVNNNLNNCPTPIRRNKYYNKKKYN